MGTDASSGGVVSSNLSSSKRGIGTFLRYALLQHVVQPLNSPGTRAAIPFVSSAEPPEGCPVDPLAGSVAQRPSSASGPFKATIVIPVWNAWEHTDRCLQSLQDTLSRGDQVVVVDNGSTDGTGQALTGDPWLKVVRNTENQGFARACNQGAALADGDVVFPNNDTAKQACRPNHSGPGIGGVDLPVVPGLSVDVCHAGLRDRCHLRRLIQTGGLGIVAPRTGRPGIGPIGWCR